MNSLCWSYRPKVARQGEWYKNVEGGDLKPLCAKRRIIAALDISVELLSCPKLGVILAFRSEDISESKLN